MTNEEILTKWLQDNTDLSWNRTAGDSPAIKQDLHYINRSEAYEIKDLIIDYYNNCKLEFSNKNFKITLKKINKYKLGKKVSRDEILNYLINNNAKCKNNGTK